MGVQGEVEGKITTHLSGQAVLFSIQKNLNSCLSRSPHETTAPPQLMVSLQGRCSPCQVWHAFNCSCHHSKPKESGKTCLLVKLLQLAEKEKDLAGTAFGGFLAFSHGRLPQDYEPPKNLPHSQNEMIHPLTAEQTEEQFGGSILNLNVMLQAPLLRFLYFFLSAH